MLDDFCIYILVRCGVLCVQVDAGLYSNNYNNFLFCIVLDLCLESSQNLFSKKSGIITLKLRNGDGDSVYVVERVGSDSGT